MPTPEERRRAKAMKKAERQAERQARKKDRAAKKEAKRVAARAAKAYRQMTSDKAYCTTCHVWYDPTNKKQNRKHNHL